MKIQTERYKRFDLRKVDRYKRFIVWDLFSYIRLIRIFNPFLGLIISRAIQTSIMRVTASILRSCNSY